MKQPKINWGKIKVDAGAENSTLLKPAQELTLVADPENVGGLYMLLKNIFSSDKETVSFINLSEQQVQDLQFKLNEFVKESNRTQFAFTGEEAVAKREHKNHTELSYWQERMCGIFPAGQ